MEKLKEGKFEFSEKQEDESKTLKEELKGREELLEKAKIAAEVRKNYEKYHLDVLLLGYQEAFKRAAARLEEDWMDNYYLGIQMLLKEHKLTEEQRKLVDFEKIENMRREVFQALIPKKIKEEKDWLTEHYDDFYSLSDFPIAQLEVKARELGVGLDSEQRQQLRELRKKIWNRKKELEPEIEKELSEEEKKRRQDIDKHNKQSLGLDNEQYSRWKELMSQNMEDWPKSLMDYVKEVGARIGFCGEVFADSVAEWIKKGKLKKK